jgi:hypothetical protein
MFDDLQKDLIAKWYQFLLILAVGNIILSVASFLPIDANMITWARYVVFLFTAYCLLQLRGVHVGYRKAAIFRGLFVLCALANGTGVIDLTLAVTALSLLAAYLEYAAHGKAIRKADPILAKKWYTLFNLELLVLALGTVASMAAAAALTYIGTDTGLFTLIQYVVMIAELALQVFYLLYLKRTRALFLETE